MILRLDILTEAERAHWDERAAIVEYEAGLSRAEAEAFAWREVMRNRRRDERDERRAV